MLGHEILGEGFTPFQTGSRTGWPGYRKPVLLEKIDDSIYQRCFRTHHRQVDLIGEGKLKQLLQVGGRNRDVLCDLRCPRISRSTV